MKNKNPHLGSSLDDFLREEGRGVARVSNSARPMEEYGVRVNCQKRPPTISAGHASVVRRISGQDGEKKPFGAG